MAYSFLILLVSVLYYTITSSKTLLQHPGIDKVLPVFLATNLESDLVKVFKSMEVTTTPSQHLSHTESISLIQSQGMKANIDHK